MRKCRSYLAAIGGFGALSYRGDWINDDIQDMVFYPGDVITWTRNLLVSVPITGGVEVPLVSQYMATAICFTDDPSDDDNFTIISGSTLATA